MALDVGHHRPTLSLRPVDVVRTIICLEFLTSLSAVHVVCSVSTTEHGL